MKYSRIAFLALFLFGCAEMNSVTLPVEQRSYSQIHEVPLKKQEIYDKSLQWMARTFVDSKEVIELKDPVAGQIIGKGITHFEQYGFSGATCRYTMVIEIKDGRYRTTFTDLTHVFEAPYGSKPLDQKADIDRVMVNIHGLDDDLVKFVSSEKKDW